MSYPDLRKGETHEEFLERRRRENRLYRERHSEQVRKAGAESARRQRSTNPESPRAAQRRWRDKNREHLKAYVRDYASRKPKADPAKERERKQKSLRKLRAEVLDHYGGQCACCGEKTPEFLCIDHMNGGGRAHRASLGIHSGQGLYRWLRNQGYPTDFQILCHNCNCAKGFYGSCPHHTPSVSLS